MTTGNAYVVPIGSNFISAPDAAALFPVNVATNDGGATIYWTISLDGSNTGVGGQHLDTNGNYSGPAYYVNDIIPGTQQTPYTAKLTNGNILVGYLNNSTGVIAKVVSQNGSVVVNEYSVDYFSTTGTWMNAAADNNGGYVITWLKNAVGASDNGIYARHYDASGNPIGNKATFVQATVDNMKSDPEVVVLKNGNFFIASYNGLTGNTEGKFYDPYGAIIGSPVTINNSEVPSTTLLESGQILVSWYSNTPTNRDIYAKIYNPDGTVAKSDFLVNTATSYHQIYNETVALKDGGFVILWQDYINIDSNNAKISGQRFDANGNAIGGQFDITDIYGSSSSSYPYAMQPYASLLENNHILVSWKQGYGNIKSQIFEVAPVALNGTSGNDNLTGTPYIDVINGLDGNDTITGLASADTIDGGNGIDTVSYASSVSGITLNLGSSSAQSGGDAAGDVLNNIENAIGSANNDSITGSSVANNITAGDSNDSLSGLAGNDSLYGGNGDDTINGGADNDVLNGDDGRDSIYGGTGNDSIYGGIGIDTLYGGDGNDYIDGGTKNDFLFGENGNDALLGNWGNDILDGGAGADSLTGGLDADSFKFSSLADSTDTGRDVITDFTQGADKIDLISLGFTGIQAGAGSGTVLGYTIVGGHTIIEAANSDFSIDLTGSISLTNSDFIFS